MPSVAITARLAKPVPARLVAGCSCVNLLVALWAAITRPALNCDFRGLRSFAVFARWQKLAQIYQAAPLQALQHQLYPGFRSFFPFQYPPSFLLPVWFLGHFSYLAALWFWTLAGLAALAAAGWVFFRHGPRWFAIAALLAAPASLLNGVAGETGYFSAAILLAGFALLPSRPVLAGIGFGLLTVKPQLGLLIPFALLGRRDYPAMLAAGATALALILFSCAVFPASLWADWLQQTPIYQAQYLAAGDSLGLTAGVTLAANLIRLGFTPPIAWAIQFLAGLAAAGAIVLVFRRAPYGLAVAALFAGTCLCAPHAYAYDTIQLTAAMLLLPGTRAIRALCVLTYLAPCLLLTGANDWFFYAIPETLLFLGIIYLALHGAQPPDTRHEPVSATKPVPFRH